MYSALVVVYTAYCALQIVLLTLHIHYNKAYNPPTPYFHYANIAYGTQFSNRLCYTHAVQPYLVQRPAKCPLRLCFSNDVCRAPNSWKTTNQRHGFMAGWHWQKFRCGVPTCLYYLNCTKFGQLILRKIIKAKMQQIRFRLGELTALPQTP